MSYLKYTQYIYIVFAGFFVYDAYAKWSNAEDGMWLSLMIAGVSVFMFFFRRKFAKKIEENKNKS